MSVSAFAWTLHGRQDLNLQPSVLETAALPIAPRPFDVELCLKCRKAAPSRFRLAWSGPVFRVLLCTFYMGGSTSAFGFHWWLPNRGEVPSISSTRRTLAGMAAHTKEDVA